MCIFFFFFLLSFQSILCSFGLGQIWRLFFSFFCAYEAFWKLYFIQQFDGTMMYGHQFNCNALALLWSNCRVLLEIMNNSHLFLEIVFPCLLYIFFIIFHCSFYNYTKQISKLKTKLTSVKEIINYKIKKIEEKCSTS